MSQLIINRLPLNLDKKATVRVVVERCIGPTLCERRASWVRDRFLQSDSEREQFSEWMNRQEPAVGVDDQLSIRFYPEDDTYDQSPAQFSLIGRVGASPRTSQTYFKFELGTHLQQQGFIVDTSPFANSVSAYQHQGSHDENHDVFRRIDFDWDPKSKLLSYNVGSDFTLISKRHESIAKGRVYDDQLGLVYRSSGDDKGRSKRSASQLRKLGIVPPRRKLSFAARYQALSDFGAKHLHQFGQNAFRFRNRGFMSVSEPRIGTVAEQGRQPMIFGSDRMEVDPVTGMREHGPFRKPQNVNEKALLFVYNNRSDANQLYKYLKFGRRHFPGLLSYANLPVTLAEPQKGVPYESADSLCATLEPALSKHYPSRNAKDVVAVVIGPFSKNQSTEEQSEVYYDAKKLLLEYGMTSQFIHTDTINNEDVHYMLPNIAIGLVAKAGGIPWKLGGRRRNELVVGLNTKLMEKDRFLGSAVFLDNEGRLGCVRSLPISDREALVSHLHNAICKYADSLADRPERITIHYYKPPRRDEIWQIAELLHEHRLDIPWAVVEVNDSAEKTDMCFDVDYKMGVPQSGTFVRLDDNQYLLFNNNRYSERPNRTVTDQFPLKLRIWRNGGGGFTDQQLIEQVYEFCHLNWSGLHLSRSPITTKYSKLVAQFSSRFGGCLPENETVQSRPWFL